jgi:cyclopropane-fatty-acyl-phospholipid synthase
MVDAITISVEQAKFARERVMAEGLNGRVHIHLLDYRKLPPSFEKAFDACISTEMLEVSLTFTDVRFPLTSIRLLVIGL